MLVLVVAVAASTAGLWLLLDEFRPFVPPEEPAPLAPPRDVPTAVSDNSSSVPVERPEEFADADEGRVEPEFPTGLLELEIRASNGSIQKQQAWLLRDGRALAPLSTVLGASRIRVQLGHRLGTVVSLDEVELEHDLALLTLSDTWKGELEIPAAPKATWPSYLAEAESERLLSLSSRERLQLAELGNTGDLLLDSQGRPWGLLARPAVSEEILTLGYAGPNPPTEAVQISGGLSWQRIESDLSIAHETLYLATPRGLHAEATRHLEAARGARAWGLAQRLVNAAGLDTVPGTRQLHEDCALRAIEQLEATSLVIGTLQDALAQHPDSLALQLELARQLASDDDLRRSLAAFRQAALLAPDRTTEFAAELCEVHAQHLQEAQSRGSVADAISELQLSLYSFDGIGKLHLLLGLAYLHRAMYYEAEGEFERAATLDPKLLPAVQVARQSLERATTREELPEGVTIEFPAGASTVRVDVLLNERVTANMIVDTGATRSALSHELAQQLRLRSTGERVRVTTASGDVTADLVELDSLDLAGLRVEQLQPVVLDLGSTTDGLLGNDFLQYFRVSIDQGAGILTLEPR